MKEDNLSLRLKFALNVLDISQTELAKRINVKPQVIQYLCASQSQKSKFTAEIAEALNIDFIWLATGKGVAPNKSRITKKESSVPLLSFEQIREWKVYGNDIDLSKITNWIAINEEVNHSFAVEINDRAMAPRFDLNTIIIIEPIKNNHVEHNSFILVYISEEDFVVFRQVKKIKNRSRLLIAINKNLHKDIKLKEEDLILGICKEARWSV